MSQNNRTNRIFVNNTIRSSKVICIDTTGKNLGTINFTEALNLAKNQGLDLVQVTFGGTDKIPTCKITNYGKYKYDLDKKEKEAAKKQKESIIKVKEIKFRPTTGLNDLKIKARKAMEILDEGDRIKVTIQFKGREVTHKEVALQTLNEFAALVSNAEFSPPVMEGKFLSCTLEKRQDV